MKKIFIICLILFMFFSIASVSASDANDTVIASESQNNLDDSLQIDNKITEESEIANVNDTNNYFDNNEEDFYQNEPLSISFENSDVLGDDPDFQYVVDGDAYGSGVPMYVAMTDYGFILKDGNIGQQRYFTQHSDGNYYPSCYAESFDFDPHTFKIGDDTYLLTYGSGDVWYYKKISYSQPKYSSIIVEDYDFVNHQYPFIGSGDQYSSVSIPVQVLDSNGNGANGGIIVTDSLGTQVGTAQVSNGYARVSMTLTKSGKSEYNIKFNSANSNVASTSTSFYITARAQQVSIFLRAVNNDEELVLRAGSTVRLDVATLGASSGAMCFVWRDAKGKQLYAADADNPVFQIDSSEHPNCLFNVPEWEGDYMITLYYGSGSAWHDFDVKASRTYKVHVILAMSLSGPDNITAKIGSSVNFNVYVKEKVVKDPDLQTDDPFAMFNNYKWISVDGGYVSAEIHGNEYQFPVVNGVANINLYVDGYIGNPTFNYKRGVNVDCPISINFNYMPCDIELIYDNPISVNSDLSFYHEIAVFGNGVYINSGNIILDIIDKNTQNITKSYTSKVSFGKATFNITLPVNHYDYVYTLRYAGYPTINNSTYSLDVQDFRIHTLKSYLLDMNYNNITYVAGPYPGNTTFKIKVTDEFNNVNNNFIKLVIDSKEYTSKIINNEANFNFINNYIGKNNIRMYYVVDEIDFYLNDIAHTVYENNRTTRLSLYSKCISGQDKYLDIELYSRVSNVTITGNVKVIINGIEYSFYYDGPKKLLLTLPDKGGEYKGWIKYQGSKDFDPLDENFTINVVKASTSIIVTSPLRITSENITITGYLNCDESLFENSNKINIYVGNTQYPTEIVEKRDNKIFFKSEINIFKHLSSIIKGKITFEETEYLKSSKYEFNLHFTKKTQELVIHDTFVKLGKNIPIEGYFKYIYDGFKNDGEININVVNTNKTFRFNVDGNYSISKNIPSFSQVGTYECHVKFENSKLFYDCETSFTIVVIDPLEYSVDITTNVVVKDNNYLNGADINIKLSQDFDLKVDVILNNQKVNTITIRNGFTNIHVNNLIIGENTIKVELNDEDYYGSCLETFYTQKILSNDEININIPETNSNNDELIVITLPEDAKGEVILTINNHEYKFKVENGISNVKLPDLKNGNYKYIITYSGDSKYSSFTKSSSLVVKKILKTNIIADNITVVYKSNKYVNIYLKDSDGNPVTNVNMLININSQTSVLGLDSLGTTSYSTALLKPKTYVATLTFEGNKQYEKSTIAIKVIVKKATPKITAKSKTFKKSVKTKKYTITLKNNLNKVMKNTKVTIKVNKKTYSAKTNSKGVATFKITKLTKKGTFKSIITYKGDKYYNKVTKIVNIKVK